MADTEPVAFDPTAKKKKSRKSVAFSDEGDGDDKTTAEKHSIDMSRDETLESPDTLEMDISEAPETSEAIEASEALELKDEGADLFKGMKKKKKSSKEKSEKEGKEGEEGGAAEAGEFDATQKKRRRKKAAAAADSFEAKLAEAGLTPAEGEEGAAVPAEPLEPADAGDPVAGTGVWASNSDAPLSYPLLLSRFFTLLRAQHPDLAGDGRLKAYKIPPPQVLREGNRKTIFANISEICKKMKRHDDHVTQFLFAELGTSGSVDGSKRLVIKGRFQQKQLENVLRRYILEYVTCRTCKSPDTELKKGENRLYFVTCNSCGSRRSVSAIKTGFQATVGKRRKAQA